MTFGKQLGLLSVIAALAMPIGASANLWEDASQSLGLDGMPASRVKFSDLDHDGAPDAIILIEAAGKATPYVFLNRLKTEGRFLKLPEELPVMSLADVLIFADLDQDGVRDAILGRYLDFYQENYAPPEPPDRSAWFRGKGDGTFEDPLPLTGATMATTRAMAVGDVNEDGYPDLFIGNWYERYFSGYESFENDLLLQVPVAGSENLEFIRWSLPAETVPTDYHTDLGGRPTYGVALPLLDDGLPFLLELNYGRRWNRLYQMSHRETLREINWGDREPPPPLVPKDPRALAQHKVRMLKGEDVALTTGVDGDAIRHGRHPKWPEYLARDRPRSTRPDEPPFRANGNEFDAAIGDIDNDGDFDMFLTTIIHAWAGESSDRSRFLVNQLKETGELNFLSFEDLSVDRIPKIPPPGQPLDFVHARYNQGDIYAELADLNHDGRLDLVLCSSDYPDPPPHDERLRVYFQQTDGRFLDVTQQLGIDHVGAGMPALADIDMDGDLDIMVGQSFNRLSRDQRRAAAISSGALAPDSPEDARPERRTRIFLNHSAKADTSLQLYFKGNPSLHVTEEGFGTRIHVMVDRDGDSETLPLNQIRQVLGPLGHAGKQHEAGVHFGVGTANAPSRVTVDWPGEVAETAVLENIKPGRYLVSLEDDGETRITSLP